MEDNCKISRWDLLKSKLNNLDPNTFLRELQNTPNSILIDVRRPSEFINGSIDDAINIDYLGKGFWEEIEELNPEKNCFIFCRSGRRSIRTCTLMQNGGFKKVYNLDGGLIRWLDVFGSLNAIKPAG